MPVVGPGLLNHCCDMYHMLHPIAAPSGTSNTMTDSNWFLAVTMSTMMSLAGVLDAGVASRALLYWSSVMPCCAAVVGVCRFGSAFEKFILNFNFDNTDADSALQDMLVILSQPLPALAYIYIYVL